MSKRSVTHAFSAGGVVFRPSGGSGAIEIVLVGRTREQLWALPKGTPIVGETREMTALREVREESGIIGSIVNEIGEISYSFTRKNRLIQKQVFHYLMLAVGGSVEDHDHEYDEARWFPLSDVERALSYENERAIARQAAPLIHAWLVARTSERAPEDTSA